MAFAADDEATRPYRAEDNSHLSPLGGQAVATLVAEVIQGFQGGGEDTTPDKPKKAKKAKQGKKNKKAKKPKKAKQGKKNKKA